MTDRLTPLDVSFLYLEEPTAPMHVGGVLLFRPLDGSGGFDLDRFVGHVGSRLASVPRYRQRVREVPGRLGNPVWVDAADFDLRRHVRRTPLPAPGTEVQLWELVAGISSRPLDRSRPLWEVHVVDGLSDGRVAVVTKTHHAMVDGAAAVDVGAILLDGSPALVAAVPEPERAPHAEPSAVDLVADAVVDLVRRPGAVAEGVRAGLADVSGTAGRAIGAATGLLAALRAVVEPLPASPLTVEIGSQRRYAVARTDLDDYRRVRKAAGCTVNDVLLATVTGALRVWLLSRGEQPAADASVRALVPVSTRGSADTGRLGNSISAYLVDLPVGEPDPATRLDTVSSAMRRHKEDRQYLGVEALVALSAAASPPVHAMGARLTHHLARRLFNVVVTNVPGPQVPLYAAGAQLLELLPVVPLSKSQALGIGATSYDGRIFYGLTADLDAVPDLEVVAAALGPCLAELVAVVR